LLRRCIQCFDINHCDLTQWLSLLYFAFGLLLIWFDLLVLVVNDSWGCSSSLLVDCCSCWFLLLFLVAVVVMSGCYLVVHCWLLHVAVAACCMLLSLILHAVVAIVACCGHGQQSTWSENDRKRKALTPKLVASKMYKQFKLLNKEKE